MSIISKIRDFIAGECPHLKDFRELFIDYLEPEEDSYSLEVMPAEPIVKRMINGDTVRRKVFSFCSRGFYSGLDNVDTSDFFEGFSGWLEDCTLSGRLPALGEGREARSLRATTDGYLYDNNGIKCQYRIQCECIYYQERSTQKYVRD